MTYEQLIDHVNNFDYIKNNNIEVEKIQFQEIKSTGHRYIWVRFKKQKYKAGLYLWPHDIRYTQVQPAEKMIKMDGQQIYVGNCFIGYFVDFGFGLSMQIEYMINM